MNDQNKPQAAAQTSKPNPDLKSLDRLVGTWKVTGDAQGEIKRAVNVYGDRSHWSQQRSAWFTALSFLNVNCLRETRGGSVHEIGLSPIALELTGFPRLLPSSRTLI